MKESQIRDSIRPAGLVSGDLILAEMQNGTLCILYNGIPLEDHSWKSEERFTAHLKFEELRAYLTAPLNRHEQEQPCLRFAPRAKTSSQWVGVSPETRRSGLPASRDVASFGLQNSARDCLR